MFPLRILSVFLLLFVVACSNYHYKFSRSKNLAISEGFVDDFLFIEKGEQIVSIPFYLHHESIKNDGVTMGVGDLRLKANENEHFELYNILVAEVRPSLLKYEIQLKIKDNTQIESDKFFELEVYGADKNKRLKNRLTVYLIEKNVDFTVPGNALQIKHLNSFQVLNSNELGALGYSPAADCIFVIDRANNSLVKMPFWKDPARINTTERLDWKGKGIISGILPFSKGIIALLDQGPKEGGEVVLLNFELEILDSHKIGYTPINPRMGPNESIFAIPCPGYPSEDYAHDPRGSVYLFEFSKDYTRLKIHSIVDFSIFESQRNELSERGVRLYGPFASVAQDLEPNALRFSMYSDKLFINFQVNNAMGVYDYQKKTFEYLKSYGWNEHAKPGHGMDVQKHLPQPFIGSWPIKSLPQPGDFCLCEFSEGEIVFTANEGKPRRYANFTESIPFENLNIRGNAGNLPEAYQFVDKEFLGLLEISTVDGDNNRDGILDDVLVFGSRSISAYNPDSLKLIWNSGEQIERYLSKNEIYGRIFNADEHSNDKKSTSISRGPQPFRTECLQIGGRTYVVVLLKKIGGIAIFDLTHPDKKRMVSYVNSRTLFQHGGDLEPEDFVLIRNNFNNSFTLAVSHAKSSSIGFYKVTF
jgi:hypothetical protein